MQTAQDLNLKTTALKPFSHSSANKQKLLTTAEINEHISNAYWGGRADQGLLSGKASSADLKN